MSNNEQPDAFARGGAQPAAEPGTAPIATAPVKRGEAFGYCLLLVDRNWLIGRWAGEGWFSDDGLPVSPTHWAPLPRVPTEG